MISFDSQNNTDLNVSYLVSSRDSTQAQVTRPQGIPFETCLLFAYGYKLLILKSCLELELGPQFTNTCFCYIAPDDSWVNCGITVQFQLNFRQLIFLGPTLYLLKYWYRDVSWWLGTSDVEVSNALKQEMNLSLDWPHNQCSIHLYVNSKAIMWSRERKTNREMNEQL